MNVTADSVWSNCLKFIKDNIQPQAFKTWFEPIKAVKLADNVLSIEVPSKFFYEWLEEHYVKILKVSLQKAIGEKAKLVYIIKMENNFGNSQPFTEKIPSSNVSPISAQNTTTPINRNIPELKNRPSSLFCFRPWLEASIITLSTALFLSSFKIFPK